MAISNYEEPPSPNSSLSKIKQRNKRKILIFSGNSIKEKKSTRREHSEENCETDYSNHNF